MCTATLGTVMASHVPSRAPAPATPRALGRLLVVCVICACGLFVLALADDAARAAAPWADALFWLGLLVVFVPVAWRLLARDAAPGERVALLQVLGIALFLVKMLAYPLGFSFFDEFIHWRTAADIQAAGHLFTPNSLLPISPDYPGLEVVTSALAGLTGLSLFQAGLLVLLGGRLLLVGSLYGFYVRIGRSPHLAGLATLAYMLDPHFVFFESQFAYESLALPLGAAVLYLVAKGVDAAEWSYPGSTRRRIQPAALCLAGLLLAALAVTHHLTSYAVVAFLMLWAIVACWGAWRWHAHRHLAAALAASLAGSVGGLVWLLAVRGHVVAYVAPHLTQPLGDLAAALTGHGSTVPLFQGYGGPPTPAWETFAGAAAVALVTLGFPWSFSGMRRLVGTSAAARCLMGLALAYPATQVFRLSASGTEIADRLPDVLFVAVGFAVALACAELDVVRRGEPTWRLSARQLALASALALAFVGGVCIGTGPTWMRLPGPALVEADMRSLDPQHIQAAKWMLDALGPGNRVATDRDTRLYVETYGNQLAVTSIGEGVEVSPVFTAPSLHGVALTLIRAARLRYLVLDGRLCQALPAVGIYFETDEPGAYQHATPLSCAALDKFDSAPGIDRLYDNGELVVYDAGALLDAAPSGSSPPPSQHGGTAPPSAFPAHSRRISARTPRVPRQARIPSLFLHRGRAPYARRCRTNRDQSRQHSNERNTP